MTLNNDIFIQSKENTVTSPRLLLIWESSFAAIKGYVSVFSSKHNYMEKLFGTLFNFDQKSAIEDTHLPLVVADITFWITSMTEGL